VKKKETGKTEARDEALVIITSAAAFFGSLFPSFQA